LQDFAKGGIITEIEKIAVKLKIKLARSDLATFFVIFSRFYFLLDLYEKIFSSSFSHIWNS